MAKGKRNPHWKDKVLEWEASDKSPAAWSKKNNIPYTTFLSWKQRFEKSGVQHPQVKKASTGFLELKDQIPSGSGISLECQGIKICLEPNFNPIVLKQALNCLRGASC